MNSGRERELSVIYKIIAEQYLINMLSLKRLDERFSECGVGFETLKSGADKKNNGLKFITLINNAHIERLNESQRDILNKIYDGDINELDVQSFIEQTYQKVLAGDTGESKNYEFYKSIYGDGILPANSIVFCFRDKSVYNADGSMDWEMMKKKSMIFLSVKQQFECLVKEKMDVPIYLVRL